MPTNVVTYRTDNIVKCASNTTQSDSHLAADLDPTQPTRRLKFVTQPNPIRGWTTRPMSISVSHTHARRAWLLPARGLQVHVVD